MVMTRSSKRHHPDQHGDIWFLILTKYIKKQEDMASLRATCTSFRDQIDRHVRRDMLDDEVLQLDQGVVGDHSTRLRRIASVPPWSKVAATYDSVPFCPSIYSNLYHLRVEGGWGEDDDFDNEDLADIAPGANHMHQIKLEDVCVWDLAPLLHVHTVELWSLGSLVDIGPLRNSHQVTLNQCNHVTDVSPLAKCRQVRLLNCASVHDLAPLANVDELYLHRLGRVSDVSKLGRVHDLTLEYLDKITSLRGLGDPRHQASVDVVACKNLVDVSSLANVNRVLLNICPKVVDVSSLGTGAIEQLTLHCLQGPVLGVHALANVPTLNLAMCNIQQGLEHLTHNQTLTITYNGLLENLTPYANCQAVDFHCSPRVVDVTPLANVAEVRLSGCVNLIDVSPLAKVQQLNLRGCHLVEDVSALGEVPYLCLAECTKVKDVSRLGRGNIVLELEYCDLVEDVAHLGSVCHLDLRGCTRIPSWSLLGLVANSNTPVCNLEHLELSRKVVGPGGNRELYSPQFLDFLAESIPCLKIEERTPEMAPLAPTLVTFLVFDNYE